MKDRHGHRSDECRQLFARLSEYVDGELAPDLCGHLEGHLADCPPCEAFLESLRRTIRLAETVTPPPMPQDVKQAVLEAFRRMRSG